MQVRTCSQWNIHWRLKHLSLSQYAWVLSDEREANIRDLAFHTTSLHEQHKHSLTSRGTSSTTTSPNMQRFKLWSSHVVGLIVVKYEHTLSSSPSRQRANGTAVVVLDMPTLSTLLNAIKILGTPIMTQDMPTQLTCLDFSFSLTANLAAMSKIENKAHRKVSLFNNYNILRFTMLPKDKYNFFTGLHAFNFKQVSKHSESSSDWSGPKRLWDRDRFYQNHISLKTKFLWLPLDTLLARSSHIARVRRTNKKATSDALSTRMPDTLS